MKTAAIADQPTPNILEVGVETVWIPIRKIEALKPDPMDRNYSRPMAEAIAEDIKVNGQLQPIHIRPHYNPVRRRQGWYQQITGLHRIEAQRLAGSDVVLCIVIEADDSEFSAIRDAENALRANLSKDQQLRAVSRLNDFYEARHARQLEEEKDAELQGRIAAVAKAHGIVDNGKPKVSVKATRPSRAKAPKEQKRAPVGLRALIAGILGVSSRTSGRLVRCAKAIESLTDEQREVLFPAGKSNNNIRAKDLEALAGLEPEPMRKAISLAASGMAWDRAIAEHTPAPEPVDLDKPRPEEDYPDWEWIETYCDRILPKLRRRDVFTVEAIKWREFRGKVRRKAQGSVKEILDTWRVHRNPGLYEKLILQAWYVAHPNDWIPCGNCGSEGTIPIGNPKGEKCPACDGGGFKLKIERWE